MSTGFWNRGPVLTGNGRLLFFATTITASRFASAPTFESYKGKLKL